MMMNLDIRQKSTAGVGLQFQLCANDEVDVPYNYTETAIIVTWRAALNLQTSY